MGVWNVGGWGGRHNNSSLRQEIVSSLDLDILGICETFLTGQDEVCIDDYTWFGNNCTTISQRAVYGALVGLKEISVQILDSTQEDILWL